MEYYVGEYCFCMLVRSDVSQRAASVSLMNCVLSAFL